ncbi:MAG: FtsW/RodA/SpoVE family cell cycle protein [Actinomycetaceae bacterium]|nr:FtsW/RodA/SpoVE family cell cycle protein [Actinomycetaceae bacterium]
MSIVSEVKAPRGRWAELFLTVLAIVISLGAYFLAYTGTGGIGFPSNFPLVTLIALVVGIGGHLAIRYATPYADPVLFPAAFLLNGLGLAMIYRIQLVPKQEPAVKGQLILSVIGVLLMIAVLFLVRDHRMLRGLTWTSLIAGIILLALPLIPGLGKEVNGATIWISIGSFTYQPAELAKIFFAIFFAGYLVAERDNLSLAGPKILGMHFPKPRHMLPVLLAWLICMALLALENDYGTALLFFGLFVAMLYVATERISWIAIGGVLTVLGISVLVAIRPHIKNRFNAWLHTFDPDVYDAIGGSYQLVQGLFGMGSGGLFGTGMGQGHPTLSFAANSDYIVASFAEEIGLTGLMALLMLYFLIVMSGIRISLNLRDGFGKLLAVGVTFTIALQCFIVVGGITRIIPLTGLAMPFLAHGGSALLTNWIIIGLLARMSEAARRPSSSEPILTAEEYASVPVMEKRSGDGDDTSATQVMAAQR